MMTINILPFICEAFSINRKIYKDIDKLYNKDKINFYKAALQSEFYSHPMSCQGSIIQDEYFRKALGIFLYSDDYAEDIERLIQKGWPYEFTYVYNRKKINIDDYMVAVLKKFNIEDLTDDELNAKIVIVYFLSLNLGKELEKCDALLNLENYMLSRLNHYENSSSININTGFNNMTKEEKEKLSSLKLKLFNKYNVKNFKDLISLEVRSNNLIDIETFIAFIFDFEQISSVSIFSDVKFSEKDINQLLFTYMTTHPKKIEEYNIDDVFKFYCAGMYIKYLIKSYKNFKEYYLLHNRESVFEELEQLYNSYEKQKIRALQLVNENEKLKQQIEQLERENKRLSMALEESSKNRQELISLRNFIFNLDKKEDVEKEENNIDISKLNSVKGLIIGGSDRWQQKMKEFLPNFKFIPVSAANFDISILNNIDIVFIYTNYLSHSIYYRLMSSIQDDTKIEYLSYNTNEKLVLQQIIKAVE